MISFTRGEEEEAEVAPSGDTRTTSWMRWVWWRRIESQKRRAGRPRAASRSATVVLSSKGSEVI